MSCKSKVNLNARSFILETITKYNETISNKSNNKLFLLCKFSPSTDIFSTKIEKYIMAFKHFLLMTTITVYYYYWHF